jgi:uncharacterized protein (DUF2164 family)
MKTAMMELRDILENCKMFDITDEQKSIFSSIIYQIDIFLLEKEKEQIIDAFEQGIEFSFPTNGSYYYNQTYNQNK